MFKPAERRVNKVKVILGRPTDTGTAQYVDPGLYRIVESTVKEFSEGDHVLVTKVAGKKAVIKLAAVETVLYADLHLLSLVPITYPITLIQHASRGASTEDEELPE